MLERGDQTTAIEVTSGRRKGSTPGLHAFQSRFGGTALLVGGQGVPLDEFLSKPADAWLRS